MFALEELDQAYREAKADPAFQDEFHGLLANYVGRPSRLYSADRLTAEAGGARILLKREDLNHTGAHKINNALGQVMLARRMGKKRVIAETGAGMHGVVSLYISKQHDTWFDWRPPLDTARALIDTLTLGLMNPDQA